MLRHNIIRLNIVMTKADGGDGSTTPDLSFFPTTYSLGNAYPSRYAHYYRNPDAIIKCAIYWSINDDNMILDMLEKLRMISSFVS